MSHRHHDRRAGIADGRPRGPIPGPAGLWGHLPILIDPPVILARNSSLRHRQAIGAGLEGERSTRVFIQLASTQRNVGASEESVSILESMPESGGDEGARQGFLALASYDEGRYGDALRTSLNKLIPTLDGYGRALSEYAEDRFDVAIGASRDSNGY
ncbi:tetratricopeptide repeat protein [Cellulosimicrobium funkei]|nr:tetratricopeptide repeat protein [Cellulosimicrobium funkei]